jgi:hypothetical protein
MGTYRSPGIVKNTVADALAKSTEDIGKSAVDYVTTVENKRKLQQLANNKANEDLYGITKAINDIPTADDTQFDEDFRIMLKERADKLYVMAKEVARGGDNTEYTRLKAETESLVGNIPNLIESVNYNANILDQGLETGKQPLAWTDGRFGQFLQKWNNEGGSGVKPSIVNGKFILTDSSGYIVNTDAVLKSAEKGGGIRFVENPMEEVEGIFKAAGGDDYELYSQLKTSTTQERGELIKTKQKDFTAANKRILSYFEIDEDKIGTAEDPLEAELNQNNYQFFIQEDGTYSETLDKVELRKAIVDRMKKDFMYDDLINKGTAQTMAPKSGSGKVDKNLFNKKELKQYNEIYAKANSVLAAKVNTGKPKEFELKKLAKIAGEITRIPNNFKASTNENGDWVLLQSPGTDDEQEILVNVRDRDDIIDFINSLSAKPLDLYKSAPESNEAGTAVDTLNLF